MSENHVTLAVLQNEVHHTREDVQCTREDIKDLRQDILRWRQDYEKRLLNVEKKSTYRIVIEAGTLGVALIGVVLGILAAVGG
jgi:hypothetical protein